MSSNGELLEVVLVVTGHQRGDDFKVDIQGGSDTTFGPMGCVWCDGECRCGNPTPICPHEQDFEQRFQFKVRVAVDRETDEVSVTLGEDNC